MLRGISVSWCEMGRTDGPWEYRVDRQEMYHTEYRRCLAIHPDTGKLIPMPHPARSVLKYPGHNVPCVLINICC